MGSTTSQAESLPRCKQHTRRFRPPTRHCSRGELPYVTDVGMTGALDSVIEFSKDAVLHQSLTGEPQKFPVGDGTARPDCAIVTSTDGKAVSIEKMEERLE